MSQIAARKTGRPVKESKVQGDEPGPAPLKVEHAKSETISASLAKKTLRPTVQAAFTLQSWSPLAKDLNNQRSVNDLVDVLSSEAKEVSGNRLDRLEAMLTAQAHVLDAMFNDLARRARLNIAEYPDAFERYMRLSFKAQSQCRATIETLAEVKNPKAVAFVQQANIANGPQQVNNAPVSHAGAGNRIPTNELLEGGAHGKRLEQGAAGDGLTGDSSLATMGQGDGAEVARGQGAVSPKRAQTRRPKR